MTPQEYADALAGAQPVVYHEGFCVSTKTLGYFPCDCGAIDTLRRLQECAARKEKGSGG